MTTVYSTFMIHFRGNRINCIIYNTLIRPSRVHLYFTKFRFCYLRNKIANKYVHKLIAFSTFIVTVSLFVDTRAILIKGLFNIVHSFLESYLKHSPTSWPNLFHFHFSTSGTTNFSIIIRNI